MITVDNRHKKSSLIKVAVGIIKSLPKSIFKPIPVKFPFKYFLITVISTILIWSFLLSAIIYRNAYKKEAAVLADLIHYKGPREKHRLGKAVKAILMAPYNWMSSNLSGEKIPHFYIDIKFKHYQKILQEREKALLLGRLVSGPDSYIPASIRHQNDTHKVKLRLKGDLSDHWAGDKWSFRIHMKGKEHLLGMRRFSLQNPPNRGFEGETIYFEALRREGVLTPRYFFVDLTVNGEYKGVMAFEEHFSKELLESQGRKEGVILKFDESLQVGNYSSLTFDNYMNNLIKPFRQNRISKSKELSGHLETAIGLLRGFAHGTLSSSQVFDVELMGRFLAVSSVWGAWHPMRWHNIRLYYNPITARLEPVAYDGSLHYFKRKSVEPSHDPFFASLLETDLGVRPFYEAALRKLKREAEEGITEKWVSSIQTRDLNILRKEYPLLAGVNLFGVGRAASQSLERNKNAKEHYKKILTAFLIEDETGSYFELVNHLPQKIFVSQIEQVDQNTGKRGALKTTHSLKYPFPLSRTPMKTAPRAKRVYFQKPEGDHDIKTFVSAFIEGEKRKWTVEVIPYFPALRKNPLPVVTIEQALERHSFLTHNTDSNSLRVQQGHWAVNETLVIPGGRRLIIPQGTTLDFEPQAGLVATGPVDIEGTSDEPVVLKGNFAGKEKMTWQGIAIIKSGESSIWSNAKIENTAGIQIDQWSLSGGVNFYESDIEMDHVLFSGNRSEDALNIVRSKFKLKNVTIKNTTSDAFDSDFSSGEVVDGVFENIGSEGGGDGIDVSGSEVSVSRTFFKNISDKALSVGENSQLKASEVDINNVAIGVASKDGSQLFISDSKFTDIKKAGLMAYIKKPEYGPAKISANALEIHSTEKRAIAQKGNKITIDGIEIPSAELNVKELYTSVVQP